MAYTSPYIDSTGLVIPSYIDIRDSILEEAVNIFGPDTYLEIDSADYQLISVISLKLSDTLSAIQLAYNNRGPQTATGAGLDGVVLLNGISRKEATYSTCQVILTGTVGTTITSGAVRDANSLIWDLPSSVVIGSGGTVEATAVCQTIGAIEADIGEIKYIVTPTGGWTSVINSVQAVPGRSQETDASLRSRQALSVAMPSQTLLEGTAAAILAVDNVSRSVVYENDTGSVSTEGFPAHSITAVVEGGTDAAVAQAIFEHKGVGGYINGTTVVIIEDLYGQPNYIRFYRPDYVPIFSTVTLVKLAGWSPAMEDQIKTALAAYLNSLQLGDDVIISSLWGAVLSVMPDLKSPAFSVTSIIAGKLIGSQSASNIVLDFHEAAQGLVSNVSVVAS